MTNVRREMHPRPLSRETRESSSRGDRDLAIYASIRVTPRQRNSLSRYSAYFRPPAPAEIIIQPRGWIRPFVIFRFRVPARGILDEFEHVPPLAPRFCRSRTTLRVSPSRTCEPRHVSYTRTRECARVCVRASCAKRVRQSEGRGERARGRARAMFGAGKARRADRY